MTTTVFPSRISWSRSASLGNLARVRQPGLNCFVLLEASYILGRADKGNNHFPAQRGCADRLDRNPIACFVEASEIVANLLPVDNRAVVAGIETKNRSRRRKGMVAD